MSLAICPGSFDPVTVGHLDIIRRAGALFDEVLVLVMCNSDKHALFTPEERVEMLEKSVAELKNVRVQASGELLAEVARRTGACALVKGVRGTADLEYEQMLAGVNRHLLPGLETVLLPGNPSQSWVSSTVVRELLRYHQDISALVPAGALELVLKKYREG